MDQFFSLNLGFPFSAHRKCFSFVVSFIYTLGLGIHLLLNTKRVDAR